MGEDGALVRWGDAQQYRQAPMPENARHRPVVHLVNATPDPLGNLAAVTGMYTGRVTRSLAEVTDEQRRAAMADMQKTALNSALECIGFTFLIEGVDRAFTHQLVRGRNAFYAQESLRFAVPEDWAATIPLPPSLVQLADDDPRVRIWRKALNANEDAYASLVDNGMPAEEARGLLPHATLTRVYWVVTLRELLHVAGLRTCTQAQFVWRIVMGEIAKALRRYRVTETPTEFLTGVQCPGCQAHFMSTIGRDRHALDCDGWQYQHLADLLRPVCYQTGHCGFMAAFDRACTIRARVGENEGIGRPSSEWHLTHDTDGPDGYDPVAHLGHRDCQHKYIGAIDPREWAADPSAARLREGGEA